MKMLVWIGSVAVAIVFMLALLVGETRATPVELKTETHQPSPQTSVVNQTQGVKQNQAIKTQPTVNPQEEQFRNFQDLQSKIDALENTVKESRGDPRVANWLSSWWQVGFWSGVLWMFPWVFVGTQWSRRKFWGFGWPWPWWFWIPIFWWIPWVIIGWEWWLVWWVWWAWVWWIFPWIFWIFWWLIVFKEAIIWIWKKK